MSLRPFATIVHVAGIGLRSASHCHVHHNRISGSPRYGLQADSFFRGEGAGVPDNSRFNLLEFNIISDTCRTTSDCGAVEMIGSGERTYPSCSVCVYVCE